MKKLLAALLLLAAPVFGGEDWIPQAVGPFGTLNNTDSPLIINSEKAQDLLNVDITPGGKSVKKRKGFALFSNLTVTTSPVHGTYSFYDSNGNTVDLFFNDIYLSASVAGTAPTVLFSTGTNGATWQCVDSQGFAYCVSSARPIVVKTDGTNDFALTPSANGTMVAVTPERLILAGFASFPNRIDFSKANDFTTWTVGGQPTDPTNFTITAPGSRVTHITYAHGRVYWFKDSSFGYILTGPSLADWQVRTISPNVGTLDNTSVYRDEILYFKGQDAHIYAYDGSNLVKLTRDINGTVSQSQARTSNSWSQTTQVDFEAGSVSTPTWLSTQILSGSVQLATAAALSSFSDTSSSDFGAGTLTTVSTGISNGAVTLSTTAVTLVIQRGAGNITSCDDPEYSSKLFFSTQTIHLSSITTILRRDNDAGEPGDYTPQITDTSFNVLATMTDITSSGITTGASGTSVTSTLSSPITLSPNTSYYYRLVPKGFCYSLDLNLSLLFFVNFNVAYQGNIDTFVTSGNLVSRSFDVGFDTGTWLWGWNTFTANHSAPASTSITYETQTSTNNSNWTTLSSVVSLSTPTSEVRRYIRYKASLTTTANSTSPVLNDVTLAMTSRLRPGGTFYSQIHNASSLTAWDTFGVNKTENGGTINLFVRGSETSIPVLSSTFPWTSIQSGNIPSISTAPYFQAKAEFTAYTATTTPRLDDFTFNWFEGAASDKAYATYHNDAIWWSIASGAGASANNKILRYDLINQGWTIYDIASNGFYLRNQSLYFGSASAGKIFKFGDVDNDNGEAIEAYWKSKDFFGSSPFTDDELTNISVSAGSVASSSMTFTYNVNGSSDTSYTVNLYNPTGSFIKHNKNMPAGRVGNTFSFKFGNDASDQSFEVFGIQYGLRPRSWIPTP